MTELRHPGTEELQTFAEGRAGEGSPIASHVLSCVRCQTEAEEWRTLFQSLSVLPQFDPREGFPDRVMAGLKALPVRVKVGVHVRVLDMVARALPKTTRGWAIATAFLATPLIAGGAVLAWLLSHPFITPGTLWAFSTDRGANALESLGSGAISWAMKTDAAAWLVRNSGALVHQVGLPGVGALLACAAFATTLSIYVLYKNLFRTSARETNHVLYSF